MIIPLLAAGAALLLLGKAVSASSNPRAKATERLKHTTLVASSSGVPGFYGTQAIPNTTPALTQILTTVRDQHATAWVTPGGEFVYFATSPADEAMIQRAGGYILYSRPGPVLR
jgi:hypothetical protein